MTDEWPFDDPQDYAVITIRRIADGESRVLYVTHDADDAGWQFLDGGPVTEADAMVVGLSEMVKMDPSIRELADLPLGWYAERTSPDSPWRRAQK